MTEQLVDRLLTTAGASPPAEVKLLLGRNYDELDAAEAESAVVQYENLVRGFFEAATDGVTFVPSDRIRERFGRTLPENYPEAGEAFLRFATTYWTLKLALSDSFGQRGTVAYRLLSELETQMASIFFPTPGPMRIDPSQREQTQRALLEELGPRIDIEDFISRNPILIRDRRPASTGCLLVPLLLLGKTFVGLRIFIGA